VPFARFSANGGVVPQGLSDCIEHAFQIFKYVLVFESENGHVKAFEKLRSLLIRRCACLRHVRIAIEFDN
jgi:hypothetical protein